MVIFNSYVKLPEGTTSENLLSMFKPIYNDRETH